MIKEVSVLTLTPSRTAGEWLAGMEKAKNRYSRGNDVLPLKDLGISKAQSSRQ